MQFMAASTTPSSALLRAARLESSRIDRDLQAIEARRTGLRAQLAELDRETDKLVRRRTLLGELVGSADTPEDSRLQTAPHAVLKGRELRTVAGRLLWASHGTQEVHYREWFERVLTAGYVIGGKDPLASFLTNVRDSPTVARGSEAGYYRLDPTSMTDIEQKMSEVSAELDDVRRSLARARAEELPGRQIDALRAHRDTLAQQLRRLEVDVEEVRQVFQAQEDQPMVPQAA
jgi:hypothetical protein